MGVRKNPLSNGYLLKGYRIEKTLGGGGFSLVYLATNLETQERVAIKEFLPSMQARRLPNGRVEPASVESARFFHHGIKRFFEEGSALARVHHPNIVRVTNFFRAHNTAYMVMRYEEGNDLRWYIKRHPRGLSEKFIRTVFPPLLDGLEELHRNGLLHLDIKPANIFLRPGGNPLLLDFGAAQRACESGRPNGPQTLTFGFAPIEQHEKGALGAFTDLYAMGASMYACINGRPPPPAPERQAKDKYRRASVAFAHRYSAGLLETIDWCLEYAPSQRPQTVPELLNALKQPAMEPHGPAGIGPRSYLNRLGLRWPWPKPKL
jgi:hypothetical protein